MSLFGTSGGASAPAPATRTSLFGSTSVAPVATSTPSLFGTSRTPRASSTSAGNATIKKPAKAKTPTKAPPETASINDLRKPTKDLPGYCGFLKVSVGKGAELQLFDVHESLITARSEFFKRAVSGDWIEAKERLVKLPEDDPVTFQRYVHLLYTNSLAVSEPSSNIFTTGQDMELLAHLYVLAEKLQDLSTKKLVLESMILCAREDPRSLPGLTVVCKIYDGTPPQSPMRKLLVDIHTHRATSIHLRSGGTFWPREFMEELSIQLVTKRSPPPSDPIMVGDASVYLNEI